MDASVYYPYCKQSQLHERPEIFGAFLNKIQDTIIIKINLNSLEIPINIINIQMFYQIKNIEMKLKKLF